MTFLFFIISLFFSITISSADRCLTCWHKKLIAQQEQQIKRDQTLAALFVDFSERDSHNYDSLLLQYRDCDVATKPKQLITNKRSYYNLLLQKIAYIQQELVRSCENESDSALRQGEYKRMLRFHLQGLADIESEELAESFEKEHEKKIGYYGVSDISSLQQTQCGMQEEIALILERCKKQNKKSILNRNAQKVLALTRENLKLQAVMCARQNEQRYHGVGIDDQPQLFMQQLEALRKARNWQVVVSGLPSHQVFDEFRREIAGTITKYNFDSLAYANQLTKVEAIKLS